MLFKIKNKNNNKEYKIRPGMTITSNYNETLDSAEITISHIEEEIDIEPFDECEIISEEYFEGFEDTGDGYFILYMCVDSYQRRQLSVGNNPYYEYSISLFSQTKLLEGIILPSLKITRGVIPRTIYRNGPSAKDWGYLDEYLKEYGLKYRTNEFKAFINKWQYSQRVKERFSKINCPEMQWNQPTLRQVLTDLMMVDDCIPVLRNGVIDYIDISETKRKVTEEIYDEYFINYTQQSQSSADYVSELRVNAKNVTQKSNNTIKDYTQICEKIGFRNNGTGILNDQNIKLETTYPIYDLLSLKMELWCKGYEEETRNLYYFSGSRDLVNDGLCVEKGVYDTKDIWYKEFGVDIDYQEDLSPYQNFNVYYTRGGKSIEGWNVLTNKAFLVSNKIRTLDVLANYIAKNIESYQIKPVEGADGVTPDYAEVVFEAGGKNNEPIAIYDKIYFEIKYKTTADALFQISKEKEPTNSRVVVDNQSSSYVDVDAQGFLEYMKANRLGNKMLMINARYKRNKLYYIASLGDTYNDNIIFKKTISIFDDYVMANYYATENYVLRDYFTGVKAKQRSWKLVSGDEALERHDLIKCYIELSSKKTKELGGVIMPSPLFADSPLIESSCFTLFTTKKLGHPISGSLVNFKTIDGITLPSYADFASYEYYQSELIVRKVGNSIVFTVGATDNIYFGRFIKGTTTGGYAQTPLAYADSDGENIGGKIIYSNNIISKDINTLETWNDLTKYALPDTPENADNLVKTNTISKRKPLAFYGQLQGTNQFVLNYDFHKDNSEISRVSLQFEYCTDKNDEIYIGKKFVEMQEFITSLDNYSPSTYKLYVSDTKPSQNTIEILPLDVKLVKDGFWQYFVTENSIFIETQEKGKYGYITDKNDKVILACASQTQDVFEAKIYANLLHTRNKNIYDFKGNIVGNIYINN